MSRTYTVPAVVTSITAANGDVDWWELTPADDKPIELVGFVIKTSTEVTDANEEQVAFQVIRGFTASGTGGATVTPVPVNPVDTAAGFTAEIMNTTVATTGTGTVCWADAINVRIGEMYWFPEGCAVQASQANTTLIVRQVAAVGNTMSFTGTAVVREMP